MTSNADDTLRTIAKQLVECNTKKYLKEDEVTELKEAVLGIALEHVRVEDKISTYYSALKKVEQDLRTNEEMVNQREEVLHFKELVESKMVRGKKDAALMKMEKYKAVLKNLKDLNNDEDGEIQVEVNTNDTHRFKCPLSTLTLVEPMRNSNCDHVYSKEHILQHIKVYDVYFASELPCRFIYRTPGLHIKYSVGYI